MGTAPAVAANEKGGPGRVSIVNRRDQLLGRIGGDRRRNHGHLIRKNTLAVSDIDLAELKININDDVVVVAVYRFGPRPEMHGLMLGSRVGYLKDGRINWERCRLLKCV